MKQTFDDPCFHEKELYDASHTHVLYLSPTFVSNRKDRGGAAMPWKVERQNYLKSALL